MTGRRNFLRLLATAVLVTACGRPAPELVLATTTSTQDTGLLDPAANDEDNDLWTGAASA